MKRSIPTFAGGCAGLVQCAAALAVVILAAPSSPAREYKASVPVLTVEQEDDRAVGKLQHVAFSCSRADEPGTPLRVSVVEDTPSGAGPSLRASAWLAAVIAALEANDSLTGVTLTFSLDGRVDGPSAGGVFCLAIMSALDRRDVPGDFAFTGSILPDGTVGRVAGIPRKIEAAAAAGKKRILGPSCLEFEKDAVTGKPIDLFRYARERGIRYVPVRDIESAYREVHGLEPAADPLPEELRLPANVRDYLIERYERHRHEFEGANAQMDQQYWGPFWRSAIGRRTAEMLAEAHSSFAAGYLYSAANAMCYVESSLLAWERTQRFVKKTPLEAQAVRCDEEASRLFASVPDLSAMYTQLRADGLSLAGSQFASSIFHKPAADAYASLYDTALKQGSASSAPGHIRSEQGPQKQPGPPGDGAAVVEKLFYANMMHLLAEQDMQSALSLDALVRAANIAIQPAYKEIENLFYSALLAADNSFREETVPNLARQHDRSVDGIWNLLRIHDQDCMTAIHALAYCAELHRRVRETAPGDEDDPCLAATATQLYIEGLADFAAAMVRWNELGVSFEDDGRLSYTRSGMLHGMLRTARRNALRAIRTCTRQGIPCVESILYFRSAEFDRDASSSDKVSTLQDYWLASLHAKAQVMLFGTPGMQGIGPAFQLQYVKTGARYGTLAQGQPAEIKIGRAGLGIDWLPDGRFKVLSETTGMTYGPFHLTNGAPVQVGQCLFRVVPQENR